MREIKKRIIDILDAQERKGIATYGHTLEDADPDGWNWDKMTIEELIDALQYQVKENLLEESELRRAREIIDAMAEEIDYLHQENDHLYDRLEELEEDKN